jgi:ubiquinone/menaquinone biosynthesis C-methylase UbiE
MHEPTFRLLAPDCEATARRYDKAARLYDRLADLFFERVLDVERHRDDLIGMLGDIRGACVLDVGCGTGRNFPALLEAIGPDGRLIGIDCSVGMLDQASRRVREAGWDNVELVCDDAAALTTVVKPVDAFVSAWCYGEVLPLEPALDRAIDVIRPGGRFAVMSFVQPRPTQGRLRWLHPLYRVASLCTSIDTQEVLDSAKVQAKWNGAIDLLCGRLDDLRVERFANDALLAIAGQVPRPH